MSNPAEPHRPEGRKQTESQEMRQLGLTFASFLGLVLFQMFPSGESAGQELVVSSSRQVDIGLEGHPLVEPHLAVHPGDPDHFLAAVMVGSSAETLHEPPRCVTLHSLDRGESWERHDFGIGDCFDPWVALLPDDRAVFAALGTWAPFGDGSRLLVFHSPDGGRTWEGPVDLGRGHDHESIVVDTTVSGDEPWLFVISSRRIHGETGRRRYSVSVARSRDGGRSFDHPATIVPNNLIVKAETAAVLSDGTLVVSFVEAGHARDSRIDRLGWVIRSNDGGWSFSTPLFVTESCGPPPTFSLSFLAVDATMGRFRDRLYFVCNELGGGAVVVTSSVDAGENWTDPERLHSAPSDTTVLRQVRAIALNNVGVVGILWTERLDGGCYEVYFSASVDGGGSFLPARPISTSRACPDAAANGRATRSWPTGGDYLGLAATPEGGFRIIWAEPETARGPFQLWTRAVQVR